MSCATERDALDATLVERRASVEREQRRADELAALLPGLESDEQAEVDAARARGELRAELDRRAAALSSRRTDIEVRSAGLHERRQLLEHQLAETDRRLAADVEARAAATSKREQVDRSLDVIAELVEIVDHHRATVEAEHAVLAEERRRQTDEVRALSADLDRLRRERSEQERALDSTRERARQAELGEAEAKLRLETTIETLRRELDIEPAVAEAAAMPELPEGASPAGRVRELDRELRLLGPINPLALEEFNELQGRHTFLEDTARGRAQHPSRPGPGDQPPSTRRSRTCSRPPSPTSATNFSQLFSLLFPGGTGKLVLTAPDDMLNTGIEVEAKPGGKNVKKLSLLSGGERSLTALAYLFAVFRSRPSPFYVMDEVEAALDDVNLHRFLGLIQEFRKDAQLIVVSHQKRTMEAGDCLLGVTHAARRLEQGGHRTCDCRQHLRPRGDLTIRRSVLANFLRTRVRKKFTRTPG